MVIIQICLWLPWTSCDGFLCNRHSISLLHCSLLFSCTSYQVQYDSRQPTVQYGTVLLIYRRTDVGVYERKYTYIDDVGRRKNRFTPHQDSSDL